MAAQALSWGGRLEAYKPSKTVFFWACVASIVATIYLGFSYGGWVTGATASEMAKKAADGARADLAAAVCVKQFAAAPDATASLSVLAKTDSWKQAEYIEKGGWLALPGVEKSVAGAADLCAKRLTAG